eukprot:6202690-Pleurochrysis_carterae.AAC.5
MWSPPATMPTGAKSFDELLQLLQCDTLLLYGAQDPWVRARLTDSTRLARAGGARAGRRVSACVGAWACGRSCVWECGSFASARLRGSSTARITPEFGRSAARGVRRSAAARAGARVDHVELSPAGHCPHHEVPHAVNAVLSRWINGEPVLRDERDGAVQPAVHERFVASAADARYFDMDAEHVEVEAKLVDDIEPKSAWEILLTSALR